ncbi:hypothetical protein T492DRAFT_871150 [Pavlovales sp. CCMP2436]|nr:hypothetical protein T492DRAFT_871150 [Pavlovales sp. CCMP2436]
MEQQEGAAHNNRMEGELRTIREGMHPGYKLEARKFDEMRLRHRAEAMAVCDVRVRVASEEFERDKKSAEEELKNEEELLRERFLNEFEDRRRRTDEGRFDGQFSQCRAD